MRSPKLLRTVWILAAMVATAMASDFDLSAQSSYGMNVLRRDGNTVFNLQVRLSLLVSTDQCHWRGRANTGKKSI